MATLIPFLKQSAASGTGSTPSLYRKYQENPFFRSTVHIIIIQTLLVVLITVIFSTAILLQHDAITRKIEDRRAAVKAGQVLTPQSLDIYLEEVTNNTLGSTFLILITLAGIFGFLSARYALSPTRNSLEYQKRFIGNIAHELRTPLAIIRTNTEVALMDKTLSEYSRSTFETTTEELDRISEIINNLLSFDSLLRAGRIKVSKLNVQEILTAVVGRHAELAKTRGIKLSIEGTEELWILGNPVALEQVFTNLVKNALNYTPQHEDRTVTVRALNEREKISVSVIDTGIGIAQKDLYHVFEPFYRGDTSRTRGIGSGTSGLGLAIVNDIVRVHGGSIIIRSALNRGTTIEIAFPKSEEEIAAEEQAAAEDENEHEAAIT